MWLGGKRNASILALLRRCETSLVTTMKQFFNYQLLYLILACVPSILGCSQNSSSTNVDYIAQVKAIQMPEVNNDIVQAIANFYEWGHQARMIPSNGVDQSLVDLVHHHAENSISLADTCQNSLGAPDADIPLISGILHYATGNREQAFNLGQEAFQAHRAKSRLGQDVAIAFAKFNQSGITMYAEFNKSVSKPSRSWVWILGFVALAFFLIRKFRAGGVESLVAMFRGKSSIFG